MILVLGALALVATGCGSDSGSGSGPDVGDATSATDTATGAAVDAADTAAVACTVDCERGEVAVTIATLTMSPVADTVWDLEVRDGAGAVVWQQRVTSSEYGDGTSLTQVQGPCGDPAAGEQVATLWLVGAYTAPVSASAAGEFNETHDGAVGDRDEDVVDPGVMRKTFQCPATGEVFVNFDVPLIPPLR
ncbi:MAG: hypothetical protein H6745_16655 [Deltaproteobacteria bacterium]|nr:hypothetical protein [Deltaproteobacteria bacterium]